MSEERARGRSTDGERARLAELARRRGLFFPSNEAYGGTAGFYTYGPAGATLKRNLIDAWRDRFVVEAANMEVESPDVMPEAVFEASGHLDIFDDMLVECADCGATHRADHLLEDATDLEDAESLPTAEVGERIAEADVTCPDCGAALAGEPVEEFNLMFETSIGPGDGDAGYLRPETAQGIFVEFSRLAEYARGQLPFGVAQVGDAYRNEISPRRALVRVRAFTQAELETFVDPERDDPPLEEVADVELPLYPADAQERDDGGLRHLTVADAVEEGVVASDWVAYYLGVAREWYERVGVDMARFRYRQHLPGELSHYSTDCWDAEAELGGDWIEVTGFADRGDYDLGKHAEHADEDFTVFRQYDEERTVERATVDPDMAALGPAFGGAAEDVADALADLAARDPSAFDEESVTVEVDGDTHEVPTEHANFGREEVTEAGEHVRPHVIEPSFGIGRLVYTVLVHGHRTDEVDGEARDYLGLSPELAPTTVAVFPLMDRDGLDDRAEEVAATLRSAGLETDYDDAGSIGRRYRRQDEVGTPYCVTVDYDTLEDGTVTVRERDSADQVRVPADDLTELLAALRDGDREFGEL